MLIRLWDGKYRCRFFDRFDDEARRFEDRLRLEQTVVESIPWPRISFWQGYRHLQSAAKPYFVLQMTREDSPRSYQIAVIEHASRIPFFKSGTAPYWIPALDPESARDQAELLKSLRLLCLGHTSLMTLRVHAYVPGEPALNAAEKLLRESGFEACAAQAPAKTRIIDLRPSVEEVLSRFPAKTRALLKIKKPEALRVDELRREQIPELQAALNDSFGRSTAQQHDYDFEGLFDALENFPESAAGLGLFLSDDSSRLKAFATGVASLPLYEYAASGSRSDARLRQFPFNYILLWRLVEIAIARGAAIFDMGGITDGGPEDPLAGISYFKRRFPGSDVSIGREASLALRPFRLRLHSLLQTLKTRSRQ